MLSALYGGERSRKIFDTAGTRQQKSIESKVDSPTTDATSRSSPVPDLSIKETNPASQSLKSRAAVEVFENEIGQPPDWARPRGCFDNT
jgi:hypothetical protein